MSISRTSSQESFDWLGDGRHLSEDELEPLSPSSRICWIAEHRFSEGACSRTCRASLDEAIRQFPIQYVDSEAEKLRGKKLGTAFQEVMEALSPQPIDTPEFHREAYQSVQDSTWGTTLISKLQSVACRHFPGGLSLRDRLPALVNLAHIVDGETGNGNPKGFHFCPSTNPRRNLLVNRVVNPDTGVFYAEYQGKASTFFPDSIQNEQQLLELILGSQEIGRQENRSLRKIEDGDLVYYSEVYLRDSGLIVHSAFPLFFYGTKEEAILFFQKHFPFVNAASVLEGLTEEMKRNQTQYTINGQKIVDVAPFFQAQTRVKKGIYIQWAD